jgi:siroheme synthase (precorrin-2 oxidase/ferrochelatase)
MRTNLTKLPADHIALVGTGEAAMAALWRLCAAGARIRWYADSADLGAEAVLAHALGGGRLELSFDDPLTASLDGTTAIVIASDSDDHAPLAGRARANGVAVHLAGGPELSDIAVGPSDAVAGGAA